MAVKWPQSPPGPPGPALPGLPRQRASSRQGLGAAPPCGVPATRAVVLSASRVTAEAQQGCGPCTGRGGSLWAPPMVAPRPRSSGNVPEPEGASVLLHGQCWELPAPSQSGHFSRQQGPVSPSDEVARCPVQPRTALPDATRTLLVPWPGSFGWLLPGTPTSPQARLCVSASCWCPL